MSALDHGLRGLSGRAADLHQRGPRVAVGALAVGEELRPHHGVEAPLDRVGVQPRHAALPARDVRRPVRTLLHVGQRSRHVVALHRGAELAQDADQVHHRRLDQVGLGQRLEDRLVTEDAAQDGPQWAGGRVRGGQSGERVVRDRARDELAPQLADQVLGVVRVAEHRVEGAVHADGAVVGHGGAPERRDHVPEEALLAGVELTRGERDLAVVGALERGVQAPAGERAGERDDVVLRVVVAAVGRLRPEAEQLHQLARVVLVRAALHVLIAVQVHRHRGVDRRHLVRERAEAGGRVREPQQPVAVGDEPRCRDAVVAAHGPVPVPEEGEPLGQRVDRALHPVEPLHDQLVLGRQRVDRLVAGAAGQRRRAGRGERRRRVEQPVDELEVPAAGPVVALPRRRPEAGAPEQAVDHRGGQRVADRPGRRCRRLGARGSGGRERCLRRGAGKRPRRRHHGADRAGRTPATALAVERDDLVAVAAGLRLRVGERALAGARDPAPVAEHEVRGGLRAARRRPRQGDAGGPGALDPQPAWRGKAPTHARQCDISTARLPNGRIQVRTRASSSTAIAALRPLSAITLPAGCVAAPHR